MTTDDLQVQQGANEGVWGELFFTYADEELDHDPDSYLKLQKPHRERPKRGVWKQLHSLRPELDQISTCSEAQRIQTARIDLAKRGFAVLPHFSHALEENGIETQESYSQFVRENQQLIKTITGADEVIVWNTVKRDSTVSASASLDDDYEQQQRPQGIESRFDKPIEPPALFAHIDQDPSHGARLCSMAIAGTPYLLTPAQNTAMDPSEAISSNLSARYARTMIVNLWRPVGGTVYDKPLALADYRSLDQRFISRHANPFGCGYDLHAHDKQQWHFVPHQTNHEVLVFKCYDSLSLQHNQRQSGETQEALYGAHCAVTRIKGDYPAPPPNAPPRKSVEVRFVAVWR
jgi:hypothetical protein